jgi:coenzyme F420 biosynthesis associated uncharacterized protein
MANNKNSVPPINPRVLGAGLLATAALGALYAGVKKRQYAKEGAPHLLDWNRVRKIALQVVREESYEEGWQERWEAYYRGLVEQCYPIITAEMGRALPAPVDKIEAFTRRQWIEANVSNFRDLFEHIEGIYKRVQNENSLGTMIMAEASQTFLSSQLGVLLGYLARRVLGQYDLALLGKETVDAGKLYFVEPNIAAVQAELGLDPSDFRLWIALHETTHAYEFEAYPWVRTHFNSLLESYISLMGDDILQFGTGMGGVRSLVDRAKAGLRDGDSWVEAIMSPEQRELFNKLQATMSIVEGYSNYIMNSVGQRLLPSYEQIKLKIEERAARRSPAEKLFIRMTGLALKMEQYRLGETFINAVVAERGIETANRVWEGPQMIPTLEELRDHKLWLERVDRDHVPSSVAGDGATRALGDGAWGAGNGHTPPGGWQ